MKLTAETYKQIVAALKSDEKKGEDKRRQPRVGIASEAELITVGNHGKRVAGKVRIRDVSVGGLGLIFGSELREKQRFVIQLDSTHGSPIWLVCLTAHCRKASSAFLVGARVEQVMLAEQMPKVESHVGSAAVPANRVVTPLEIADINRISKAIIA